MAPYPQLAGMQGPALLAYNDAPFSDDDWGALRNIDRRIRRTPRTFCLHAR